MAGEEIVPRAGDIVPPGSQAASNGQLDDAAIPGVGNEDVALAIYRYAGWKGQSSAQEGFRACFGSYFDDDVTAYIHDEKIAGDAHGNRDRRVDV